MPALSDKIIARRVDALHPVCGHLENELTMVSIKSSRTDFCYGESTDISREDEMAVICFRRCADGCTPEGEKYYSSG